jgi:hypothetical protein
MQGEGVITPLKEGNGWDLLKDRNDLSDMILTPTVNGDLSCCMMKVTGEQCDLS